MIKYVTLVQIMFVCSVFTTANYRKCLHNVTFQINEKLLFFFSKIRERFFFFKSHFKKIVERQDGVKPPYY